MLLNELLSAMKDIKNGVMVKVCYQTIKGDYKKETNSVVRFVEYAHINGVIVKGVGNTNESHIDEHPSIIYNANKDKYYLQMATCKTPYKSKSKYYFQNVEITKEEYEKENPPRKSNQPLVVFRKAIEDIISIG